MEEESVSNKGNKHSDEIYLKIWEVGHNHTNSRWNNATYFLTISFAIFGFSFQRDGSETSQAIVIGQRVAAVAIYWFAIGLFFRFNDYTRFLREYLRELEDTGSVRIDLQTKAESFMKARNWLSSSKLLLAFGVIYTIGTVVTLIFRIGYQER